MAQNEDLVADAQTLLADNLSEKKSVESARRLLLTEAPSSSQRAQGNKRLIVISLVSICNITFS